MRRNRDYGRVLEPKQVEGDDERDDFIAHRKRGKFVAPEGATVAVRQNDGRVRVQPAIGYMPTVLIPAKVGNGGTRRERRARRYPHKK